MSCFSCASPRRRHADRHVNSPIAKQSLSLIAAYGVRHDAPASPMAAVPSETSHQFTLRELAAATENFKDDNLIGEGGFGKVYRGRLESGQAVAVKQLNREGLQGTKEFLVECLMLVMLHHPNLVSLVGYCAEGDERLLVYEFMPQGSLEAHLFYGKEPLGWNARVKIALGVAKGLAYLHNAANPPVIYRDLKSANVLLDRDFEPKLSDFGLAKLGPVGGNTHVTTRVMGTYGYCAPEYAMSGKLTVKSDLYSYGVLLLELITGRQAFDFTRPAEEQNLIVWSRPFLSDRRRFLRLADPSLRGRFPLRAFYKLTIIALMCLTEKPHIRPASRDVAVALEHVAGEPYVPKDPTPPAPLRDPAAAAEDQTLGEDKQVLRTNTC